MSLQPANSNTTKTSHAFKNAVELEQVNKAFKTAHRPVQVLKDVSLTVALGDFLIIFGPSGCGKSTLLHLILGLESPTQAKLIKLLGQTLHSNSSSNAFDFDEDLTADFRKEHVGMVYQQTYWIKSLNVKENVAFPLLLLGHEKISALNKASEMLDSLGLLDWAEYVPTELSSGQQQKVNLARALINDPEILIADEPTGNLDFLSGQELMKMFVQLNKKGKTIIMVTHDLEYMPYAGKAAEMFDGQITGVYQGQQKQEILHKLKSKKLDIEQAEDL